VKIYWYNIMPHFGTGRPKMYNVIWNDVIITIANQCPAQYLHQVMVVTKINVLNSVLVHIVGRADNMRRTDDR
jgi:hypothetical protein